MTWLRRCSRTSIESFVECKTQISMIRLLTFMTSPSGKLVEFIKGFRLRSISRGRSTVVAKLFVSN